ncbi:MAG: hypothetical protein CTY25_00545 [Methylobacterium sp.]|nr:MAG: hypothetical protein CTY25_00545 [Methylobacterium sp.]
MPNRRTFITGALSTIGGVAAAEAGDLLQPTTLVDSEHPLIRDRARTITTGLKSDRERALAIFRFVRDDIRFGFAGAFWRQKASDVLATGYGFCNTKSTLFVALLRAAGIPARPVFVDIDAGILRGFLDPGTAYVDHSYTEVELEGRWIATDSYIIDAPLFRNARARLAAEGRALGYGTHRDGTPDWDGRRDAFVQWVAARDPAITRQTFGRYHDVADFYDNEARAQSRLGFPVSLIFPAFALRANRAIAQLRAGGTGG